MNQSLSILLTSLCAISTCYSLQAQINPQPNQASIQLRLPKEIEIQVLLDLSSTHLGLNLLYDESIRGKRVSILAQDSVTPEQLHDLLKTALAMKDLVIVPTDVEGWFRVAPAAEFLQLSGMIQQQVGKNQNVDLPITHVFSLKTADPQSTRSLIEPYLTKPGGVVTLVPETQTILVTDLPEQIQRIEQLISLIDQPPQQAQRTFFTPQHTSATDLANQINQVLKTNAKQKASENAEIVVDNRSNRLVFIGQEQEIQALIKLAETFDTPDENLTKRYSLINTTPDRLQKLIQALYINQNKSNTSYQSTIDEEGNALLVRASPRLHDEILKLKEEIDQPTSLEHNPIVFYKVKNTSANDLLQTIKTITQDIALEQLGLENSSNTTNSTKQNTPPLVQPTHISPINKSSLDTLSTSQSLKSEISGQDVTVGIDEATNTIIVVGPPTAQQVYEKLIQKLDVRPPQVLVEVMLVTIDTSDGYQLGVEISRQSDNGETGKLLSFSAFGLSEVDLATGFLTPGVGLGFNGALLESNIADVVIQALKSDGNTRVQAAPSILINDGKSGSLVATSEQPTTSTSQGSNSDTTSFSGYVSAGTTVNITPRIAEGDHLALEYQVELSSFDDEGASGIPAPRQTNTINSDVTIPNGTTIVLGGLNRTDQQETVNRVPILGEIPLLEYLFSNRSTQERNSTLFVFIKAQIMRDDNFQDLKTLSSEQIQEANISDDYPTSQPIWMQ